MTVHARVSDAVTTKIRALDRPIHPDDICTIAQGFSKSEDHEAAAMAFDLAADTMRGRQVPSLPEIIRWEKAAERERLNAQAGW